jgi:hypothetical protein
MIVTYFLAAIESGFGGIYHMRYCYYFIKNTDPTSGNAMHPTHRLWMQPRGFISDFFFSEVT